MRLFIICTLVLFFVSCAPIHVTYDYDKASDFGTYKTYQYYADMETGLSELDENRLLDAIDLKLKSLGLSVSDAPDFYIDIKSKDYQEENRTSIGLGLGSGGVFFGGMSIALPLNQSYVNRQIVIDFVNHDKKQLFWQAVGVFHFNFNQTPKTREADLNKVVEKIFSKYPPKK